MKDFKIRVTPEQSRIVQKEMFRRGYKWFFGASIVLNVYKPILYFKDGFGISLRTEPIRDCGYGDAGDVGMS